MRTWLGRVLDRLGPNGKVRFARLRAGFWGLLGIASVPLGWANSVALVWAASVYANVASEMASAEASDESAILDRLEGIEQWQREDAERSERIEQMLTRLLADEGERPPENAQQPAGQEAEEDDRDQGVCT